MSFLMMYGLSIALAAVMLLIFEADSRSIDYAFNPISMKLGPIYVSTARLVAFGVTVVVSLALAWFLYRTLPGKALRATIMNREAIQIVASTWSSSPPSPSRSPPAWPASRAC